MKTLSRLRRQILMKMKMIETTIKHTFTHDDDDADTELFYRTVLDEIDALTETANLNESSISITFDDDKKKIVLLVD